MAKSRQTRILLLLLPIMAVVFISGCTSSTPVTGPGVQINEFAPDLTNIRSGEQVDLKAKVTNSGEATARNVVAEIIGIDLGEWNSLSSGLQSVGDLSPSDSDSGTPGETQQISWTNLYAPELGRGLEVTYEPTVRVSYDYQTRAIKPITIVDQDELIRIKQRGTTLPNKQTQYTAAPLSVEIRTGNFVKTSGLGGTTYDIFPIYIKVTNVQWEAGGSVIPELLGPSQERYPVKVTITPPTGTNFVFSGFSGSSDCGSFVIADLWQGKDAELTCELEVTSPPTTRTEGQIMVDLDYRYYMDKSTSITVTGTGEGGFF